MEQNCMMRNVLRGVVRAEWGWCVNSIWELKTTLFLRPLLSENFHFLMGVSTSKHLYVYLFSCMGSNFICGVKKCVVAILTYTAVRSAAI
jgi:hypothetical protein